MVQEEIADYASPELMDQIQGILASNQVTNGINVKCLEEEMAEYLGVDHVAAVSSCTLGQTLALQAAGIVGKEVIVPSFTIAATANAAYWNGCKLTFADIDPDTFNISLDHVERLISEDTGAIMPVPVSPLHEPVGIPQQGPSYESVDLGHSGVESGKDAVVAGKHSIVSGQPDHVRQSAIVGGHEPALH